MTRKELAAPLLAAIALTTLAVYANTVNQPASALFLFLIAGYMLLMFLWRAIRGWRHA